MEQAESMSLKLFAERQGVSGPAVSKAIRIGRLRRSVARDANGRAYIADYRLACLEWRERSSRPVREDVADAPPATPTPAAALPATGDPTLAEAQRTAVLERARKLKLENDLFEGSLVKMDQVLRESFTFSRAVRENVLNVPPRLAAAIAAESDATRVHLELDRALRQALEATAAALEQQGYPELAAAVSPTVSAAIEQGPVQTSAQGDGNVNQQTGEDGKP